MRKQLLDAPLKVRFDQATKEQLTQLAQESDLPLAAMVRKLVKAGLKSNRAIAA